MVKILPHQDGRPSVQPRFFGRRQGPGLSPRKKALLADHLPALAVSSADHAPGSLDPRRLFSAPVEAVELEIGFGKGEHLAARAAACPQRGFIGCEPYINGVASLVDQIDRLRLRNIRICADDARPLMAALARASLRRVYLLHPDPWPKTRHAGRRFVNPANIDSIARLLVPGGHWWISTDHPVYLRWTALHMAARPDFDWQAEGPADWRRPPAGWIPTRYETKALEGRATYFCYRRNAADAQAAEKTGCDPGG